MPVLTCPHCSAPIDVPTSRAGSEIACPTCHKTLSVPKLGELRRLAAENPENAAPSPIHSSTAGRATFAGLMAVAAIALLATAFCFSRYIAIEVPVTTEEHIAEIEQAYAEVPAGQLVREWQQLESFGPDVANPYIYQQIANEKARWLRNTLIGLAITVATAIAATLSIVFARKADMKRNAAE